MSPGALPSCAQALQFSAECVAPLLQYQHFLRRCEADEPPLWRTAAEAKNAVMVSSETLSFSPARPSSSRPPSSTTAPTSPPPATSSPAQVQLILILCSVLLLYIAAVYYHAKCRMRVVNMQTRAPRRRTLAQADASWWFARPVGDMRVGCGRRAKCVPMLKHASLMSASSSVRSMYFMYFLASLITGSEAADPSPPPPYAFASKADLRAAVVAWDPFDEDAIATYGPIADWDVSAITDMSRLFSYDYIKDPESDERLKRFDSDISSWDTSGVTTMAAMFQVYAASHPPP